MRAHRRGICSWQIELRPISPKASRTRIAPSFETDGRRHADEQDVRLYSATTISEFLGWDETKVKNCLSALALIEQGIATDKQFDGLSSRQAAKLIRGLHETLKAGVLTGGACFCWRGLILASHGVRLQRGPQCQVGRARLD